MAGPGSTWTGPLQSGPKWNADANGPANVGLAELAQTQTITQNGTATVSAVFVLPAGSQVMDIVADTTTAWNSGTSDTLTAGITQGGTDYAGGVNLKTAGRAVPTYTAAQLAAMANIGNNTTLYATATPVGTAATAGTTVITLKYIQTVQLTSGAA